MIPQGIIAPDSVRSVLREVFSDPAYTRSEERHPLAFLGRWLRWLIDALGDLADHHPGAYYALLCALVVVLAAIMVHAGWIVWQSMRARQRDDGAGPSVIQRARDAAWHLAEFRRLAAAGRYTEALAHRFMALVTELHAPATTRLDVSLTPAEHARAARLDPAGHAKMELLVDELYRRLFGGTPCTAEDLGAFDGLAAEVGAHRATR